TRVRHQGSADGNHLLLTARQRTGRLPCLHFQDREQIQYFTKDLVRTCADTMRIGPQTQDLFDGHFAEQVATFGTVSDPGSDNRIRTRAVEASPVVVD